MDVSVSLLFALCMECVCVSRGIQELLAAVFILL